MKKTVDKLNKLELAYPEEQRPFYHNNCAEIIMMAANERYKLELDEKIIKAVCPFGGGLQSEKTCGALLGAVAALGVMFTEDKPSTNDTMKEVIKSFVQDFEKEFGSLECTCIKAHHRSETEGCYPVKIKTAELFDELVRKFEE
ncbi:MULTISPECIES: C-GCAxxG-C-C family protein [unclassified Sedimentibacter]|uniref:C-GCAxxG-C-C family protein n=1 Tax=unclassified Sedimentibacter TaxID=2649220 RepID=UPI0027E00F1A|nr:C-GCAxxG-C-C family protein [Sedimentibacter sp. MB35-C1]WMJ76657.1 C-GCAxxG-C-C family protein [Sedimentibacter sp. MB35-C1]